MFGKKHNHLTHEPVSLRRTVSPSVPDLTWECHVCGEERPDKRISVFSRERITELGVRFRTNVRYCNDRPECRRDAPMVTFGTE